MVNIYSFLNNVFQEIKQENNKNNIFVLVILVLLSIPLSHFINSVCLGLLIITAVKSFRKNHFKFDTSLCFPIGLYLLMVFSYLWSIDTTNTIPALLKELPLLIIPISFLLFRSITQEQKQIIFKFYSYGIFLYSIFYLLKATIRFYLSKDSAVFFYHELVTKDVNAIHVSVYIALAFFYFFTKPLKKAIHIFILLVLLTMVFLLSSKNIIIAFVGLVVIYHLFYSKLSKQMRLKNLIVFLILLGSLTFVGKIKERFKQEYETIMTDSTVNDVISKGPDKVYNVSIKQAWNNPVFKPNDFFPGTAFRVYQFRIFIEMLQEDPIFFKGYGLNASYIKIREKGIQYNLFLGDDKNEGYQTKNFHNQYVQIFAELGVFGFIILIIMVFVNLKNALKKKDFMHISFAVLMISLFLTESFLYRQRGVVFFTMMYCLFNTGMAAIKQKNELET